MRFARTLITVTAATAVAFGALAAVPAGAVPVPTTAGAPAAVAVPDATDVVAKKKATKKPKETKKPSTYKVYPAQFGLHVSGVNQGADWPTVRVGSLRLWDTSTGWAQVEKKPGEYDWTSLDAALAAAKKAGTKDILLVLGTTPEWAATKIVEGYDYPLPGSASAPKNFDDWDTWVRTVATRYQGQIRAYQVWNEASLLNFWNGTPDQMGELTERAYKIIKSIDPKAIVVAASTTTRLEGSYLRFFPPYLQSLKERGWPVDAFAGHFYPPGDGTPNDRVALIQLVQNELKKAGAPKKPLWDTESNFGLAGPGDIPKQELTGSKAAAWVSRALLDSVRTGLARTYWYLWSPPYPLLGIQLNSQTTSAKAWQTTYDWVAGGKVACTTYKNLVRCTVTKGGKTSTIAFATTGTRTILSPTGTDQRCNVLGSCVSAKARAKVKVGGSPVWFGPATS
ncbi:MAG: hypothetical protein R2737_14785 [Candidatus Nanopelagicales bacterium]